MNNKFRKECAFGLRFLKKEVLRDKRKTDWGREELKKIINGCVLTIYNDAWIPTKLQMPKEPGMYLISLGKEVMILRFDGEVFRVESYAVVVPDAWKPLPESYKSEQAWEVQDAGEELKGRRMWVE